MPDQKGQGGDNIFYLFSAVGTHGVQNLWTMWRRKNAQFLQWTGAGLKSLHRREVLRLFSESRRVVARLYHPDDHDCLVLTGPMT